LASEYAAFSNSGTVRRGRSAEFASGLSATRIVGIFFRELGKSPRFDLLQDVFRFGAGIGDTFLIFLGARCCTES